MRTIKELVEKEKIVWMYLESEEVCKAFYRQAHEEGFHFGDLPYEQWATGYVVAVHDNGRMGHLPIFIWTMAFGSNGWRGIEGSHTPVDYRLYMTGEQDYICKTSHFRGVMIVGDNGQEAFTK